MPMQPSAITRINHQSLWEPVPRKSPAPRIEWLGGTTSIPERPAVTPLLTLANVARAVVDEQAWVVLTRLAGPRRPLSIWTRSTVSWSATPVAPSEVNGKSIPSG